MASTASSPGVALITGAAKGIGRAIALRLAKNGYDVGMNDLPTAAEALEALGQEIASLGRRSYIALGDVSVPDSVENIVSSVVENLGHLDVMVANAGICRVKPLIETEPLEWEKFFAINARSVFLCYKYAAQQMIKQGTGGRIVGAASIAGKKGVRGLGAYSATKFAVCGLTQVAAQEWGRHGITVNAYCPGVIETDIWTDMFGENRSARLEQNRTSCAVGYHGSPDDVAHLVAYLVSKEAHFITGQSITIDGGRELS